MIYLITIIFTLAFILYTKYQFEDDKLTWVTRKEKWHPYGMVMRIAPFAAALVHPKWQDVLLSAAICIILFEVGINVAALNQSPFYTGKTAKSDKVLGKIKWLVFLAILVIAIFIKIK